MRAILLRDAITRTTNELTQGHQGYFHGSIDEHTYHLTQGLPPFRCRHMSPSLRRVNCYPLRNAPTLADRVGTPLLSCCNHYRAFIVC